ncbi:MAG: dihydrofolate reductase family protein, partial [Anaerolineaceae bacterium]|nr:dihydrofolate reductase family protein [Anaerolineaceae bacterium]
MDCSQRRMGRNSRIITLLFGTALFAAGLVPVIAILYRYDSWSLIEAGVGRVVAAAVDPDPRVSGRGLASLEAAGIVAECGLLGPEAREINMGFVLRLTAKRPMITLKLATTLDGRIATHGGESHWITGDLARNRGHLLRAQHDAIMVGVGTAIADAPQLTCRLPGLESRSPARVILDGRGRLPLTSPL